MRTGKRKDYRRLGNAYVNGVFYFYRGRRIGRRTARADYARTAKVNGHYRWLRRYIARRGDFARERILRRAGLPRARRIRPAQAYRYGR